MKNCLTAIFAFCVGFGIAGNAFAQNTRKQCTKEAASEHTICVEECHSTRDQAVLNCKVPAGDCGDSCKAAYVNCAAPFDTQRESCRDTCEATFEAARAACGVTCSCTPGVNCGTNCFGSCMDKPAIDRASCRAQCVRNNIYRNGTKACGKALRFCSKGCEQ